MYVCLGGSRVGERREFGESVFCLAFFVAEAPSIGNVVGIVIIVVIGVIVGIVAIVVSLSRCAMGLSIYFLRG